MLEAEVKDQGHKCKCFSKKKGLEKLFSVDLKKNGLEKHFSANLQNFNHSKNSAVLEQSVAGQKEPVQIAVNRLGYTTYELQ